MCLLKAVDERGFVFYTNYRSRKGRDIGETRFASLLFYWSSLERQVRIEGAIGAVSDAESDAYFASRPLESRWSAVASPQSEVIDSREDLEARVAAVKQQHGEQVPRPAWWGGYRVVPTVFEFWQGRPNRLHDRLRYTRRNGVWVRETAGALAPRPGPLGPGNEWFGSKFVFLVLGSRFRRSQAPGRRKASAFRTLVSGSRIPSPGSLCPR